MLKRTVILYGILMANALGVHAQTAPTALRAATATGIMASAAGDYVSTRYMLSKGGREGNPIMRPLLKHEPAGFAFKFGTSALLAHVVDRELRKGDRKSRWNALAAAGVIIGLNIWLTRHNLDVASRMNRR